MSTLGSIELLLAAFQPDTNPAIWQAQLAHADTDKLAVSAIVLGWAPLFHWQLTQWSIALPPRAEAKLLATRRASAARQVAITSQLSELLDACAPAHIELLVLKGAYLATHVYPEPDTRPMNDIDVLVQPEQLPALETILLRLGYAAHYKSPESGARVVKHTSTFRKRSGDGATPNPYISSESERTIEPHSSLEESWFGLRADITRGVWQRSITTNFGAHSARALCPSDLLLHLSVHLTFHLIMGYPSLVQLVDLLMVSRTLQADDWTALVLRAREQKVSGFIYAALRLARITLHAPIPEFVLRGLAEHTRAHVRAHAETLSLQDVMHRTQRPPLTTLAQRLQRGIHERRETARWARSIGERAAVWRTLVDVSRTDTARLIGARLRQRRTP